MRYDLTSLEVFVAVAESGNLTRAGARQHLAVSAISKRIAELEEVAGAALLLRHARGVSLTAAGQSMLHYARQLLQVMERMRGELSEYAGGLKGVVRVHASRWTGAPSTPWRRCPAIGTFPAAFIPTWISAS